MPWSQEEASDNMEKLLSVLSNNNTSSGNSNSTTTSTTRCGTKFTCVNETSVEGAYSSYSTIMIINM